MMILLSVFLSALSTLAGVEGVKVESNNQTIVSPLPMIRRDGRLEGHESPAIIKAALSELQGTKDVVLDYGSIYYMVSGPLLLLTLVLAWLTRPRVKLGEVVPVEFYAFQWRYLSVWALAIAADWLQGPYVYVLYASYGYSSLEIAQLFVAGFGASMLFGTFVGSVADAWGRKFCAVVYCILYSISCATKHSSIFGVLMVGRITGGVATSLLFSTFECWMVAEHRRQFSEALLRYMFGLMFSVQYMVAIVSGVIAQGVATAVPLTGGLGGFASLHYGGFTGPFDLALVILLMTIPVICFTWDENYGERSTLPARHQLFKSVSSASKVLCSSWSVAILGVVVTTFEGSMYSFVFSWTPALDSKSVATPHGLIFSAFMMACMCGSSVFTLLDPAVRPEKVLLMACVAGALALGVVMANVGNELAIPVVFVSFLAFEACVGFYFPAMGALKSLVVPEEARAGVYNTYRVPLNGVVCSLILSNFSLRTSFAVCCILLVLASISLLPMQRAGSFKSGLRAVQ